MRLIVGILVGALLGFGAGWLAFDPPFDWSSGPSEANIEIAVLKDAGDGAKSASCVERQHPKGTWDCDVEYAGTPIESIALPDSYTVEVLPDDDLRLEPHSRF